MRTLLNRLIEETDGATAIEYSLMAALIGLVLVVAGGNFGDELADLWGNNNNSIGDGLDG